MPTGRWGLSLSLCVTYQPQEKKTFIYLFLYLFFFLADSVKCLHEVDALCQIVHQLAHFKGIHL